MTSRFTTPGQWRLRGVIWGFLCAIAAFDVAMAAFENIRFTADANILRTAIGLPFFFALCPIAAKLSEKAAADGFKKLSDFFAALAYAVDALVEFAVFILAFVVLSYIAATSTRPFFDEPLFALDRSLGFDWLHYVAWVNAHSLAATLLKTAYHSAFQVPCLFFCLGYVRTPLRIQSVMLCLILTVIVCIGMAAIFPAVDPFTYLKLKISDYPNVDISSGYAQVGDLYAMRQDGVKTIALSNMKGMISFPSFHTGVAIIMAWGWWAVPKLRWPFLLLNAGMLAAIPVIGGHYLIDMIVGAAIAVSAIIAVSRCVHARGWAVL